MTDTPMPTVPRLRTTRLLLGMARRDPEAPFDFLYERLPEGHPHRPHVTYRLRRKDWVVRRDA